MKKKIIIILTLVLVVGLCFFWYLRTKPGLPSASILPSPTPTPKLLLQFSLIGDPESNLENLNKALQISINDGSEFAVVLGDLTHVGSEKELKAVKEVLEQSGLKYHVIPGNHDVYTANKLKEEPLKYFIEVFGKPYQRLLINDVNLVLIDNSNEQKGIDADQWEFIRQSLLPKKAALDAVAPKFNFILMHQPIYHSNSLFIMGFDSKDVSRQKDELLNLVKTASPSAIFAGHLHHTSLIEKDGLKFYIVGAANFARNWQTPRFLEVKVFGNGNFTVSEIEL